MSLTSLDDEAERVMLWCVYECTDAIHQNSLTFLTNTNICEVAVQMKLSNIYTHGVFIPHVLHREAITQDTVVIFNPSHRQTHSMTQ